LIKPTQDGSWPICTADNCPEVYEGKHWCERVANIMRKGEDLVHIGVTSLCVPYLPSQELYAEVRIDNEVNPDRMPGVYRLYVVQNIPLMPPGMDRKEIELALWTQGEGRASICLTVRDWVRGLSTEKGHVPCSFSTHGYRENMKLGKFDAQQWEINDFFCATESACWFCFNRAQAVGNVNSLLDPADDNQSPAQQNIRGRLGSPR
jgi:hypothetical protein